MEKISLVIMAAGIGSRYGSGVKQLAPVGLHGEIFMDYSIHDAIAAGFNKIIVIIRKDIEADFKECVGERLEAVCKAHGVEFVYTYQEIDAVPFAVPEARTKPWGTGHAVLCAKELIDGPFAVINADDYYGKESFTLAYSFLTENREEDTYCLIGFVLKNTLSENGSVTRGICTVDEEDNVLNVEETRNIVKTESGAESNGRSIDIESVVSMNMWGLTKGFLRILEDGFMDFYNEEVPENPLKSEYLLPIKIGALLRENKVSVKLLKTDSQWFGITYKEDKEKVQANFKELILSGEYREELYSDL